MRHAICFIALLAALQVFAQPTDETANRNHFFPLIVDGDGFQTNLFIANVSDAANQCTLDLQGQNLETNRFRRHPDVTKEGARATIEFTEEDESLTLFSSG